MFRILKERMRFFYWLPRILAMLFIGFLSLFALDVFIPGQPLFSMIGAFLIHLIPSFILTVACCLEERRSRWHTVYPHRFFHVCLFQKSFLD